MRPRQNRCNSADSIFKCISLNKNALILLTISLTFVSKVQINNIPGLVQIMACCRPGNEPLSEPMVASFLTHICMTWLQWVNYPCITSDMSLKHNSSVSIRQSSDIKCETSHPKLKQKYCHVEEIFVAGCTENDNFLCSQWRKILSMWQHFSFSECSCNATPDGS